MQVDLGHRVMGELKGHDTISIAGAKSGLISMEGTSNQILLGIDMNATTPNGALESASRINDATTVRMPTVS